MRVLTDEAVIDSLGGLEGLVVLTGCLGGGKSFSAAKWLCGAAKRGVESLYWDFDDTLENALYQLGETKPSGLLLQGPWGAATTASLKKEQQMTQSSLVVVDPVSGLLDHNAPSPAGEWARVMEELFDISREACVLAVVPSPKNTHHPSNACLHLANMIVEARDGEVIVSKVRHPYLNT